MSDCGAWHHAICIFVLIRHFPDLILVHFVRRTEVAAAERVLTKVVVFFIFAFVQMCMW